MRFASVLISSVLLMLCLPAYCQDTNDQVMAVQKIREIANDLDAVMTPLKGLDSIILAVTYMKDYKRETPALIENDLLHSLTVKLRAAGFKVLTEPDRSKQIDAQMQAILNWDHKSPLNQPELEDLPMLEMHISAYKWVDNTTVVTTDTKLAEKGCLARDPNAKRSVISWTTDIDTEVVENNDLRKNLVKVSTEQINDFIRDWARQNRKRSGE